MLLDSALRLAAQGFRVFPIAAGKKTPPAIKGWQKWATTDAEKIRTWWEKHPNHNIGISTDEYVVVDVDMKGKKNGNASLLLLDLQGFEMPGTYTQTTPTGGRHLVYRVGAPVRQGTDVLGPGLDTRGRGGFIVGAGSAVDLGVYTATDAAVADAPAWLVERCGRDVRNERPEPALPSAPVASAEHRARHYLVHEAPIAVEGQGGDETTYKVAARLKDLGVQESVAAALMSEHWNDRCSPPWPQEGIFEKVFNAYRYGREAPASAAPEVAFAPTQIGDAAPQKGAAHPFDKLNRDFAYVLAGDGDHVLWETTDEQDRSTLKHLAIGTFHRKHAAWRMNIGKRDEPVTELWMASDKRRSYDGIVFTPERTPPARFYNLWRGFAYVPAEKYAAHAAVEAWIEHARVNVCRSDDVLFRWLVSYFAHLVQRPWEKPLVALVFRGGKGVGKNALVERIGTLLGSHFLVTSNRRYLVGNFNGHMERLLLFVLDEAFWSGDKQAEGQLKDHITGSHHVIERKGHEPYTVENKTRIVIIGNEDWIIPASHDERRYAVFSVGDARRQDRAYFEAMRTGMEQGGYRELLRYLLDYDITGVDINDAPATEGLLEQKHATLEPLEEWWLNCLTEGRVVGADFEAAFGGQVDTSRFRAAFQRSVRERSIRSRLPDDRTFGKVLKKVCSVLVSSRRREGQLLVNTYKLPTLAEARAAWDKFIGHKVEWSE